MQETFRVLGTPISSQYFIIVRQQRNFKLLIERVVATGKITAEIYKYDRSDFRSWCFAICEEISLFIKKHSIVTNVTSHYLYLLGVKFAVVTTCAIESLKIRSWT